MNDVKLKLAIDTRENGKNVFFRQENNRKLFYGKVIGKTGGGNFIVFDGENSHIVNPTTYEVEQAS